MNRFCLATCLSLLCVPAAAQVPDLTNGGTPTDNGDLNLGPTGLRGWVYNTGRTSPDSRQILITEVGAGSPAAAAGTIAVDDVILGASGTGDEPVNFTDDARKSLAYAIANAEARNPGILKLLRWRDGVTETVQMTLETLGAYSATAPYNCPKSAAILEKGLQRIMAGEGPGLFSLGTLVLMATDDPSNPDNAARQARALAEIQAAIPSAEQIAEMNSEEIETGSKVPWTRGHQLILFCEYYLKTGDATVLPVIEAHVNTLAKGQSPFGSMGHQFAGSWPDGSPNGPMNGYGAVNSAAVPALFGLVLAKKCGIEHPKLDPAIERASRFFASYAGKGSIPYGEGLPGASHSANGKSGIAALAFELLPNHTYARDYFTKMSIASATEREDGHTGTGFNKLWSPLGAAVGGDEAAIAHFKSISWHLDLFRRWDGSFEYRRLDDGGRGYSSTWRQDYKMSTSVLLTYALPLRKLHITGAGRDPEGCLSPADVAQGETAATYAVTGRTTNELIDDLSSFSGIVRSAAANELATRTAEKEQILATLTAMATDLNGNQRTGACEALGKIADPASAPVLAALVTDEDNNVRYFATQALRLMPQSARMPLLYPLLDALAGSAKPTFPLDEEDPAQFANAHLVTLLFYSGGNAGPAGMLLSSLDGIDRNYLYPAIRAAANHPLGIVRGSLKTTYPMLTDADVLALADVVVDSVKDQAPGDTMFSAQVREAGMELLQPRNIAEGVPLAKIIHETDGRYPVSRLAVDFIGQYAGSAPLVKPDPKVIEFLEAFWVSDDQHDGDISVNAAAALAAIAADTDPEEPTPYKSIQSVTADASTLTLPVNRTKLRVKSFDYAKGDSRYTWRKVHGAGEVSFSPNGTAESRISNVLFDGTPGQYLLEVTMSDSRGLTEVSQTVAVTLLPYGGTLPANAPPTADAQSLTLGEATATPITLAGHDPEGYVLSYKVTSQPANGRLEGTAPYLIYTSDYDYTGSDSFTFEVMDSEGQVASATVNITVGAAAPTGLAIYEPFDYAAGPLNGKSGASELGLTGTWAGSSHVSILADSIGYGPLPTKGGKISMGTSTSNIWGGSRPIDPAALAANGLLDDGATLWFSATAGVSANAGGYLRFALANSPFATGGGQQYIQNEGPQMGAGVGFSFGAQGGFSATTFGNSTASNFIAQWDNATSIRYYGNDSGMVVGKITWGATPEDPDTIEIYEPNTNLLLPAKPISVLTTQVDQSTFDTLAIFRGGNVMLDEIRFGSNYHSVLVGSVAMTADTSPPAPDPLGFQTAPAPTGPASIHMVAKPAYDPHGVEYYFTCTAGGGHDSGWQSSPEYTDTGLTPGVAYSYTVKARDLSPARNETAPSAVFSATIPTSSPVPMVLNLPQAEAEALIIGKGFTVGAVTTASSLSADQGDVAEQNPAAGATATLGTAVDLVISETPLLATIPDLAGQTQAAANTSLAALDLYIGTILTDYSETVSAGQIISTNPTAGSQVVLGSNVNLVVSAGAISDLPPLTEMLFEDFENPSSPFAYVEGSLPDNGKWVGSTNGFGWNRRGITDKAGGDFTAPDPNHQAFALRYKNSGITTAEGVAGNLQASIQYDLTFDVIRDGNLSPGTDYICELVAFDPGTARTSAQGNRPGHVLASATGNAPSDGSIATVSIQYIAAANNAHLGKDIGIRFVAPHTNTNALIDNVNLWSVGVPSEDMVAPSLVSTSPADGATGVGIDDDLTLVFSENVFAGNGFFTLRNVTDGTQQYFSAGDADTVTFSGNTVVLRPAASLLPEKDYTVFVSTGAVKDVIGNLFAGISGSDEWNFTTASSSVLVFADDFEPGPNAFGGSSPDVSSYSIANTSQQVNTDLWVRATGGFGSNRNGIIDESENNGATFTDPTGTQAWSGRYRVNTGLTSAFAKIGSLTAGQTITVQFDAVIDGWLDDPATAGLHGNTINGKDIAAYLVLFDGASTRTAMNPNFQNYINNTSAVLAALVDTTSVTTSYQTFSFSYTVGGEVIDNNGAVTGASTAWDPGLLGHDIAIRFGPANRCIIDNVKVTISDGPVTEAEVPNVLGLTHANAESTLAAASLSAGTVTETYSATVPAGEVLSQYPAGGSMVDNGSPVDLVVSLGPEPATVPNVIGLAQASAESAIIAANLAVGIVTEAFSDTVPTGHVISQGLNPGASVPQGSNVDLTVSLGIDNTPKLLRTTVSNVSSASWTTVNLGRAYHSPVIIATPIHPTSTLPPVVTRIRNATSTGFEVKIDRADGLTDPVSIDVSVVVVDEGIYTQAEHGVTMEAVKYLSTITSRKSSWVGEARSFQNTYTTPVVLGQVMSANDASWSAFWSMGSSASNPVDSANLNVGKHVGEDPNSTRADETIGYIVIESGTGAIEGIAYEAALGAKTVMGFGNSTSPYTYVLSGNLNSVSAAAASMSGMSGVDGAWAVLSGSPAFTTNSIGLHACEDKVGDSEQSHVSERVGYIVFE